jgi:hypothetical protein
MQGEYTDVYPGLDKRKSYVQRGGGILYFLEPKCLRRGYKLRERETIPSLRVQRRLLEMLIFHGGMETGFSSFVVCCPLVESLPALL